MEKPLRILTVVNLPWNARLGAARVWIELSAQWKHAGHAVEHYCLSDAFPKTASRALGTLHQTLFPRRAANYVRQNAERFDVIDCSLGTLPFSKTDLRFRGLLVGRSIGLYRSYEAFLRSAEKRWPNQPRGRLRGRFFYGFTRRQLARSSEKAIEHCDLLNLPNDDELQTIRQIAPHARAIVQPYGLSEDEAAAFARAAQSPDERLRAREIVFIGMWSLRKGSFDWREIIRRVRQKIPDARFTFLGTVASERSVLLDLGFARENGVRCIPSYDPQQLPALLSDCTVGIFPSYIEGFGLAVLEKIAAGIPTVAYDVPGPRQILQPQREKLLTPAGDVAAIADRAVKILRMNVDAYTKLSDECHAISQRFRWEKIADETAREYSALMQTLPARFAK